MRAVYRLLAASLRERFGSSRNVVTDAKWLRGISRHEETRSPGIYGINYLFWLGESRELRPIGAAGSPGPSSSTLIKNASDSAVLLQRFGGSKNPPDVVS